AFEKSSSSIKMDRANETKHIHKFKSEIRISKSVTNPMGKMENSVPAQISNSPKLAVAILAGGLATRLRPLTEKIPKVLLPVAGKPFLAHQLELLRNQGFTRVVLCVGHLGEMVERDFGDGTAWGINLTYSYDGPVLLGTGGALQKALPLLGDKFFVLYGDSYLPIDFGPVADCFERSSKLGLMTVYHNQNRFDTSNVWFVDGEIKVYDKKNRL